MKQFYLAEIVTKDKLIHQGLFYKPTKVGKKAILWVHGLSGTFYGNTKLFEAFAEQCEKEGIGFAAFNNRGHDVVTGIKKIDKEKAKDYTRIVGGAGVEVFEECIFDLDAGIAFLQKQGFTYIYLVGHSTGANKTCYFAGLQNDLRVAGISLISPINDRLDPERRSPFYIHFIAKLLISLGLGSKLLSGLSEYPGTSKRFLSLMTPGSAEDTYDYGDPEPKMTNFSRITKPLLVVFGGIDELADRPVEQIKKVFDAFQNSKKYKSFIVPNALHSFNGKEETLVKTILQWVRML